LFLSTPGILCPPLARLQIENGDAAHRAAAAKMLNASPEEQRSMMDEFEKRYKEI
jgi:hypothetical protein